MQLQKSDTELYEMHILFIFYPTGLHFEIKFVNIDIWEMVPYKDRVITELSVLLHHFFLFFILPKISTPAIIRILNTHEKIGLRSKKSAKKGSSTIILEAVHAKTPDPI